MSIYLEEQMKLHPSMQMQDVIKLCYQCAYGAEHLLRDVEMARRYFEMECSKTEPADIPLYENISDVYCRVNIAAWKYQGKPVEQLFDLFVKTVAQKAFDDEILIDLLDEAVETVSGLESTFGVVEFRKFIDKYLSEGICALHHSETYRENEKPAYRLVKREFIME